jgi:hypothetical protein
MHCHMRGPLRANLMQHRRASEQANLVTTVLNLSLIHCTEFFLHFLSSINSIHANSLAEELASTKQQLANHKEVTSVFFKKMFF